MHVNFKRCVVLVHDDVSLMWCPGPESNRHARYSRSNGF
jgi:hypothetical protein